MQPALSAQLKELGYLDALTSITAEHVFFVLRKLLQVCPEPGSEDCSHAEQSALVVAGMANSAACMSAKESHPSDLGLAAIAGAAGCLQNLGIHLTDELLRAEMSQQELEVFLMDLAELALECGRVEAWDQDGTGDTQLLQTAASGFAELMSSDLRLFKACPELQSASSASSSCGPLSLSDVLGRLQSHGDPGSAAAKSDGAAVMDSQAWSRQNNALELAFGDYMRAEEGFGQAHTEALKRWTAGPAASQGAALGQNVAIAHEQHCMMRRLLDALGLVQQAHTRLCVQGNQGQGEVRLCQQVQICMAKGSKLTSMQTGIMSAETQPCSYNEVFKVL